MQPEQAPDMAALHAAGVPLEDAIRQCTAWAEAHPEPPPIIAEHVAEEPQEPVRLKLSMWKPPVAKPKPAPAPRVYEAARDTDGILCLSLLHTITQMIGGTYEIDPTRLAMDGLSSAAANEIADILRRAK
jgi:hypothetical protein